MQETTWPPSPLLLGGKGKQCPGNHVPSLMDRLVTEESAGGCLPRWGQETSSPLQVRGVGLERKRSSGPVGSPWAGGKGLAAPGEGQQKRSELLHRPPESCQGVVTPHWAGRGWHRIGDDQSGLGCSARADLDDLWGSVAQPHLQEYLQNTQCVRSLLLL